MHLKVLIGLLTLGIVKANPEAAAKPHAKSPHEVFQDYPSIQPSYYSGASDHFGQHYAAQSFPGHTYSSGLYNVRLSPSSYGSSFANPFGVQELYSQAPALNSYQSFQKIPVPVAYSVGDVQSSNYYGVGRLHPKNLVSPTGSISPALERSELDYPSSTTSPIAYQSTGSYVNSFVENSQIPVSTPSPIQTQPLLPVPVTIDSRSSFQPDINNYNTAVKSIPVPVSAPATFFAKYQQSTPAPLVQSTAVPYAAFQKQTTAAPYLLNHQQQSTSAPFTVNLLQQSTPAPFKLKYQQQSTPVTFKPNYELQSTSTPKPYYQHQSTPAPFNYNYQQQYTPAAPVKYNYQQQYTPAPNKYNYQQQYTPAPFKYNYQQQYTPAPFKYNYQQQSTPAPFKYNYQQQSTPAPFKLNYQQQSTPAPFNYNYQQQYTPAAPVKYNYQQQYTPAPNKYNYQQQYTPAPFKLNYQQQSTPAPFKLNYQQQSTPAPYQVKYPVPAVSSRPSFGNYQQQPAVSTYVPQFQKPTKSPYSANYQRIPVPVAFPQYQYQSQEASSYSSLPIQSQTISILPRSRIGSITEKPFYPTPTTPAPIYRPKATIIKSEYNSGTVLPQYNQLSYSNPSPFGSSSNLNLPQSVGKSTYDYSYAPSMGYASYSPSLSNYKTVSPQYNQVSYSTPSPFGSSSNLNLPQSVGKSTYDYSYAPSMGYASYSPSLSNYKTVSPQYNQVSYSIPSPFGSSSNLNLPQSVGKSTYDYSYAPSMGYASYSPSLSNYKTVSPQYNQVSYSTPSPFGSSSNLNLPQSVGKSTYDYSYAPSTGYASYSPSLSNYKTVSPQYNQVSYSTPSPFGSSSNLNLPQSVGKSTYDYSYAPSTGYASYSPSLSNYKTVSPQYNQLSYSAPSSFESRSNLYLPQSAGKSTYGYSYAPSMDYARYSPSTSVSRVSYNGLDASYSY